MESGPAMLETERLVLRLLKLEDAERVEELASDYDVAKTTLTIPHPYPKGSSKQFISSMVDAEKEGKIVIFAVINKEDKRLIGIINISNNKTHERGELAYWIGKPFWGKGFGTEAANAILKLGFEELHLNRIFAAAFTNNPGSWRIMEKIGMKYEGTLKQHVVKWGEYKDLTYYGILADEFFESK
jgi:ribosomal-protein-alanine N-acetyltransferase